MKAKNNALNISDAILGAIAGMNLVSGLLASDLSSQKGLSFGSGLLIVIALALRNRNTKSK